MDEKAIPEIVAFKNSCKGITTEKVRDLYTYLMDFGASPKFALTETIRIVTVVENSEFKEKTNV